MKLTLSERNVVAPKKTELLLGIFCWLMFEFGFALLLPLIFDSRKADDVYWMNVTFFVGNFLLVGCVFFSFLRRSSIPLFPKRFFATVGIGLILYQVLSFVAEWIAVDILLFYNFFIEGFAFSNPNQAAINGLVSISPIPMYVCMVLLAPVTEECLVRGMIFAPLCRKKPWVAHLVSIVLFAAMHVYGYIGSAPTLSLVLSFLMYLPSGFVLNWAYQRTLSIYAPIALHSIINLSSILYNYL